MDGGDSEPELAEPPSPSGARRRRLTVVLTAAACAITVTLVSLGLTVVVGWAPLLHWQCRPGSQVAELTDSYIPAVLVNSPYGGRAWGNGSLPATFPGVYEGPPPAGVTRVAYGTGASMGAALGAFFAVNASFYRVANATEWGPGKTVRCSQLFEATIGPPSAYVEAGGGILGANNTSDASEPSHALIFEGTRDQTNSSLFDNAYRTDDYPTISTCGGPALSLALVSSDRLTVWFPVTVQGQSTVVPFVLAVDETYHYVFPANFGTWQVDNLSAPGGPGGGLAFSYAPCA
jgi:hypothetical protein